MPRFCESRVYKPELKGKGTRDRVPGLLRQTLPLSLLILICAALPAAAQTNTTQSQGIPDQVGISNIATWSGAESWVDLGIIPDISTYTHSDIYLYISPRYSGNPSGTLSFTSDGDTALMANESIGFDENQEASQWVLPSQKAGQRSTAMIAPLVKDNQDRLLPREELQLPEQQRAPRASAERDIDQTTADRLVSRASQDSVSAGMARIEAETADLPCIEGCTPQPPPEVAIPRSPVSKPVLTTYSPSNVSKSGTEGVGLVSSIPDPFAHGPIPAVNAPAQLRRYSVPIRRLKRPIQPEQPAKALAK